MDFDLSPKQKEWLDRVQSFMTKHVRPAVPIYNEQDKSGERWKVIPVLEDLKKKAKAEGLWNMFMPPNEHEDDEFRGAGLTNLEYALLVGADGPHLLGFGSVQLLRARHRQHGSVHALRLQGAEAQMAASADGWRDPLRLPDDGTRSCLVGRHQHRDQHRDATAIITSSTAANGGRPASAIPAARSRS